MRLRHFICFLLLISCVLVIQAAPSVTNNAMAAVPDPAAPFPSVLAAAMDADIPCKGMDEPESARPLAPGDSVTALLTLHEKGHRYLQWLVYLQAETQITNSSAQGEKPMILYTSTGNKFEYAWSPANLRARVLGPFPGPGSHPKGMERQDRSVAISANEGFLSLGMEKGAEAACRLVAMSREKKMTNFDFNCDSKPYDSARCDNDRRDAAACGITAEDERAMVAWVPALFSYFGTVEQTTNLQAFVDRVVALPSIWSMAKAIVIHHGLSAVVSADFENVAPVSLPKSWGLPDGMPVYSVPWSVTMNSKPAVYVQLIVTKSVSPLLACGGIIGLSVTNPEHPENYLTARVLSARRHPILTESNARGESPHSQ
jgi:hypothetical protein